MRPIPHGRGFFIWQTAPDRIAPPAEAARQARDAGLSWVAIKAQNGIGRYNASAIGDYCRAFDGEGVEVWLWGYLYGADMLRRSQARLEANMTADVCAELMPAGWIADPEAEYKRPGAAEWANTYLTALRAEMPDLSVGLCTYRYPSYHPEFPWRAWLGGSSGADFHAPQVYWMGAHNPAQQLLKSVNELKALKDIPVVPVGAAYTEGGFEPTVPEMDAFHEQVVRLGLPGEFWWEWYFATVRRPQFWAAIARHAWPAPVEAPKTFAQLDEARRWELVEKGLKQLGILDAAGAPAEV
jgi:hypothetical protein